MPESKKETYKSYADVLTHNRKCRSFDEKLSVVHQTTHGAKRDMVSRHAERFSISDGSPQSGFGYMSTVPSTVNMSSAYQRSNPTKASSKILGVRSGVFTLAEFRRRLARIFHRGLVEAIAYKMSANH